MDGADSDDFGFSVDADVEVCITCPLDELGRRES